MSLFSHPIGRVEKEPSKNESPSRSKQPTRMGVRRSSPLSKQMKGEMHTAFKKMLADEKENASSEAGAPSYYASLDQISSAGKALPSSPIEPSVQITQLFEKMIRSLIHIDQKGIAETTIELTSEAFSSSVFYGATITITEYSTAPMVFNVRLTASVEGLALFQAHASELSAALQKGNFGFGIHRLDTELQDERIERHFAEEQDKEEENPR